MNSPVRLLDPKHLDHGIYAETILPTPQLVRGPEDGPAYIEGPPTLGELWQVQEAERQMLTRAALADKRALELAVATVMRERANDPVQRQSMSQRHQITVTAAMHRMAMSQFALRMSTWRLLRTYWAFIAWQKSVDPDHPIESLEYALNTMAAHYKVPPAPRLLRRSRRPRKPVMRP